MYDDPWGRDTPPAVRVEDLPPLPRRLAALAALTVPRELAPAEEQHAPGPSDLPEVQELMRDGWRPAPGRPVWVPAAWPVEHRCWVHDRLPRVGVWPCWTSGRGSWRELVPTPPEDVAALARVRKKEAEEYGLPPPPRGRLWLLRSPWPSLSVSLVLSVLEGWSVEYTERGTPQLATTAAREWLSWTEDLAWNTLPDRFRKTAAERPAGEPAAPRHTP